MKIKTIEEGILDLKKLNGGATSALYMTWVRLRLERGDPDYYPSPQDLMNVLGYRTVGGINSMVIKLKKHNLIPDDYKWKTSTTFFDKDGEEVKIGEHGIYCIKVSNGVYVGLSVDLNARLRDHDRQIKKGFHRYIGREEQPEYIILEKVSDRSLLRERELYWGKKGIESGLNVLNEENFT